MTVLDGPLTAGGLAGIALPMADPARRCSCMRAWPVVVLAGLLLILPAILLIVLGRGVSGLAGYLAHREVSRETP